MSSIWGFDLKASRQIGRLMVTPLSCTNSLKIWGFIFHSEKSRTFRDSQSASLFRIPRRYSAVIMIMFCNRNPQISFDTFVIDKSRESHTLSLEVPKHRCENFLPLWTKLPLSLYPGKKHPNLFRRHLFVTLLDCEPVLLSVHFAMSSFPPHNSISRELGVLNLLIVEKNLTSLELESEHFEGSDVVALPATLPGMLRIAGLSTL